MASPFNVTQHEILAKALDWRASGRRLAPCTVAETWGSAPVPLGSRMIVDRDGAFFGSVSGGCIEGEVITEALDVVEPSLLEFGVSDEVAWRAGLTCGGCIKVAVEPIDDRFASWLSRLVRGYDDWKPTVLVTAFDGEAPQVFNLDSIVPDAFAPGVTEVFQTGKSKLVTEGQRRWSVTPLMPPTRLVIIGAVRIAQALVPIAKIAGLQAIVIDPRSAFATPERFPDVSLMVEWPDAGLRDIKISQADAVAALSHDPKIDDPCLAFALSAGCFYVGALGSCPRPQAAKEAPHISSASSAIARGAFRCAIRSPWRRGAVRQLRRKSAAGTHGAPRRGLYLRRGHVAPLSQARVREPAAH